MVVHEKSLIFSKLCTLYGFSDKLNNFAKANLSTSENGQGAILAKLQNTRSLLKKYHSSGLVARQLH